MSITNNDNNQNQTGINTLPVYRIEIQLLFVFFLSTGKQPINEMK